MACGSRKVSSGDLCLLNVQRYEDTWPQIAEVLSTEDDNLLKIRWYKGSLNSKIVPWVLLKKGHGRIDWEDQVTKDDIWYSGFTLTKKGYLPLEVKKAIEHYVENS